MNGREEARKRKYLKQFLESILRAQKLHKGIKLNDGIGPLIDIHIFTYELTYHTLINWLPNLIWEMVLNH